MYWLFGFTVIGLLVSFDMFNWWFLELMIYCQNSGKEGTRLSSCQYSSTWYSRRTSVSETRRSGWNSCCATTAKLCTGYSQVNCNDLLFVQCLSLPFIFILWWFFKFWLAHCIFWLPQYLLHYVCYIPLNCVLILHSHKTCMHLSPAWLVKVV